MTRYTITNHVDAWYVRASHGYRHSLSHRFSEDGPMILCIGLNPSTATYGEHDATTSTIGRCAARHGFGAWSIVNVFDIIETDSTKLAKRSVAWRSEVWEEHIIESARRCSAIWPCWGATPRRLKSLSLARETIALALAAADAETPVVAIGTTKRGDPRHPLYTPNTARLTAWDAGACDGFGGPL